jgi:hypothetical protein
MKSLRQSSRFGAAGRPATCPPPDFRRLPWRGTPGRCAGRRRARWRPIASPADRSGAPPESSRSPGAGTMARSTPSFATYNGSSPSISHAASPGPGTGMAGSSNSMPTSDAGAISFSALATPPRVGSRRTRTSSPIAERSASTRGRRHAESLEISASKASPSLAAMMAIPCLPMGPLSSTRSPARARSGAGQNSGSMRPTPVVLM